MIRILLQFVQKNAIASCFRLFCTLLLLYLTYRIRGSYLSKKVTFYQFSLRILPIFSLLFFFRLIFCFFEQKNRENTVFSTFSLLFIVRVILSTYILLFLQTHHKFFGIDILFLQQYYREQQYPNLLTDL